MQHLPGRHRSAALAAILLVITPVAAEEPVPPPDQEQVSEQEIQDKVAEIKLLLEAERDWHAIEGTLREGATNARQLAQQYIDKYSTLTVTIDGQPTTDEYHRVQEAREYLETAPPTVVTGRLTVMSNPMGATIIVDGERKGTAPLTITITARVYEVRVELSGFAPATQTIDLSDLQPGESRNADFTLAK